MDSRRTCRLPNVGYFQVLEEMGSGITVVVTPVVSLTRTHEPTHARTNEQTHTRTRWSSVKSCSVRNHQRKALRDHLTQSRFLTDVAVDALQAAAAERRRERQCLTCTQTGND